jgi:hypothetical protein
MKGLLEVLFVKVSGCLVWRSWTLIPDSDSVSSEQLFTETKLHRRKWDYMKRKIVWGK